MLGRVLRGLLTSRRAEENPLARYFFANPGRLIHKWHHYFEIYHRHFARFRGRSPVVVEFGVFHGGSLQMWREYFGPGTRIVGADIDPRCKAFEEPGIAIEIGDQADRAFLAGLRQRLPRIDVLIDDGGHRMEQQIATFEALYPHIAEDGVYLCEDAHTSYLASHGGGYRQPGTFIEYAKGFVDSLNGWHGTHADDLTRTAHSVHFYGGVVVLEKRPMQPPSVSKTGRPAL